MDKVVTLEQAVSALREVYGNRMENDYEDGKDAMSETLQDRLHIDKHQAKQLVEDLIQARTIRYEGSADSLPAAANQATEIPLVSGVWHL
jgi:hypothetical protein